MQKLMTRTLKLPKLTLATLVFLALAACGRTDRIYNDPAAPIAEPILTDSALHILPHGFFDESVNHGSVTIALDGTSATALAIKLQTQPGSNPVGSFNGTGLGNRAILGAGSYSGKKLADINQLSFDEKSVSGNQSVSLALLVDLECSNGSSQLLIARGADLTLDTANSLGYSRVTADFSSSIWHASIKILDPSDSSITLVPDSGAAVSLSALLGKYPNACFRNAISPNDDLPKNTATAAIMLILGDSATIDLNALFINRITIGTDIYEGLDWGTL